MVRKRAGGLLLFAGAVAGGAALGFLGERRAVEPPSGARGDPEWVALRRDPPGNRVTLTTPDGTRLGARVAGPQRAPVVVLAHSYAMSSEVWLYQIRDLADEFRVVAYDLRGHGTSAPAKTGDYSAAVLGRDLVAVIEATAGGRPVVAAGHSMGGMAVMALAQEYPERVPGLLAGVALLNTASSRLLWRGLLSAGAATLGTLEQAVRARSDRRAGLPRASDLSYLLTRGFAFAPDASPAHVAFVEELLVGSSPDVLAAFARTLGSLDLDRALEHVDVPALVLAGARDRLTPPRQGRDLAAALPDARLVELAGVGHFAPLEAPQATSEHLRALARAAFDTGPRRRTAGRR